MSKRIVRNLKRISIFVFFLTLYFTVTHFNKTVFRSAKNVIKKTDNSYDAMKQQTRPTSDDHKKNGFELGSTDIQLQRKLTIQNACRSDIYRYSSSSRLDIRNYLFSDERHGLLYCQVQKAGSSFMWDMMVKLNFSKDYVDKRKSGLFSFPMKMETAHLHALLMNSFKMMFVREPYERIFASYVDKLLSGNIFYWNYYGKVVKTQLSRYHKQELYKKCGHDVTFPELIFHIIMAEQSNTFMRDNHFSPMYHHCYPCQIKYDFIGKMETFKKDMLSILNHWNNIYKTNIHFEDFGKAADLGSARHQLIRLFEKKSKWDHCISFHTALKREWRSLQIRGIIPIDKELPFSEIEIPNLEWRAVYIAIKTIYDNIKDVKSLKHQKKEAMMEAYSLVPREHLQRLREIVKPDCELFNYDPSPNFVFNNTTHSNYKPKYFNILNSEKPSHT